MDKVRISILKVVTKLITFAIKIIKSDTSTARAIKFFVKFGSTYSFGIVGNFLKEQAFGLAMRGAKYGADKALNKMAIKHLLLVIKVMKKISNVLDKAFKQINRIVPA